MKGIFKLLYVVMIVFAAYIYINAAVGGRASLLYANEAIPSMVDNDVEKYFDATAVSLGYDAYLKDPIYNYEAKDENFNFKLNAYHFKQTLNKEKVNGMQLVLSDFTEDNYLRYLNEDSITKFKEDRSLVSVRMEILTNLQNVTPEMRFTLYERVDSKVSYITNGSASSKPIYIEDDNFYYLENDLKVNFKSITSINFYLDDKTNETTENPVKSTLIGRLNVENNNEFYKNNIITSSNNNGKITFSGSTLISESNKYSVLEDKYEESFSKVLVDMSRINEYNKGMYITIAIFVPISLLVIFFMFFFQPIRIKMAKKKTLKQELNN